MQKLNKFCYNKIKRGKKMKKVRWITGKLYKVKEFAEIIWHDQARNPFVKELTTSNIWKILKGIMKLHS